MRRTAVLLTVLTMMCAVPNVTAAPSEGPIHTVFETADASWFVRENGKPVMYVGGAYRTTDPIGTTHTFAFADRIKCWEKATDEFAVTICFGSVKPTKIDAEGLEFDPLLSQTRLKFGKTQIEWQGRGDYYPDAYPIADASFGAALYASLDRDAKANGKVMGLDLKSRGWKDWGYLSEGTFSGVLTAKHGKVTYNDDGTVTFKMKFRRRLAD